MGITNANKEADARVIECGGSFRVRLSLTATPEITENPVDIVLLLDRSASMSGTPLANLKKGADKFIDIISEATGGTQSGQIGHGSRIAIVSFADAATVDAQLITDVGALKSAVNSLTAGGRTNHADAFEKGGQLLSSDPTKERIIVMFTDGRTTVGGDAKPITDAEKEKGVVIYAVGLSGTGGVDEQSLDEWVSDPPAEHVAITPNDEELEKLFENLASVIVKPGATDIVITDNVNPCFKISEIFAPTIGEANLLTDNSLQWRIEKLGASGNETAALEFTVTHIGPCAGTVKINESTVYSDREGRHVTFPSPEITVICDEPVVFPENCPEPVSITFESCQDALEFDAGDVHFESLGRILQINATVKNVCPHKRVALAVIITEVDAHGIEHRRGLKTVVIPEHSQSGCRDVAVRCIKFVLPENLDTAQELPNSVCSARRFKARFIANYIDNDFDCCNVIF